MNNKLTNVIMFAVGAAVGSVVTWKLIKTKYEQIAQEEIESVKAAYSKRHDESVENESDNNVVEKPVRYEKPDLMEYAAKLEEMKYAGEKEVPELMDDITKPYVIGPDEFGEEDDYETATLWYYADKVLTDDQDNIIEDVDDIVGVESLEHFGEYEDDSVFVRNERLKCDYEILLDTRNYSDVYPDYVEEQ